MDATLPPLELQDALQRFTTQFTDRVTQSMEALELSSEAAIRDEALRKNLLYVSSYLFAFCLLLPFDCGIRPALFQQRRGHS